MEPNAEQKKAIYASSSKDVLIAAGAGSGKTKVLSEHVFHLMTGPLGPGEVRLQPDQLLILTFTNNAAHEMKSRIVARFADYKEDPSLSAKMLSAHVQTFDSFNQYLVSTYAKKLGISEAIRIMDDAVLQAKRAEVLEDVFQGFYKDDVKRARMVETISKFSWKSDAVLKSSVLALDAMLANMIRSKREEFIRDYSANYLTSEKCASLYHDLVEATKREIKSIIHEADFNQRLLNEEVDGEISPDAFERLFSYTSIWNMDVHNIHFEDDIMTEPFRNALIQLLDLDDEEFVKACGRFPQEQKIFLGTTRTPWKKYTEEETKKYGKIRSILKKTAATKSPIRSLEGVKSIEEETARLLSFAPDIQLLFELVKEMNSRLDDIKKASNSYTFADISEMAIRLLTEFPEVKKAVRARFRYIMVDEYQDTNDAQEVFLDSLLKGEEDCEDGARLFCVGDAKQSIYAFRNSNVELFRNRQKRYLCGKNSEVIPMNKNYRSGPGLLKDLNYLFGFYMRLDHGGIDYKDPMETLQYDEKVNIYGKEYHGFGVTRLVSPFPIRMANKLYQIEPKKWEALAILNDIKQKVASGYEVYDRSTKGPRPCKYSDFIILMRTKKQFTEYQTLFNENGVKLNNLLSDNLREVGPIMVIQSLLGLFSYVLFGRNVDVRHLFASIARSYAYEYDDERIYQLISGPLENLKNDAIWRQIKQFCEDNKKKSFNEIFINMLIEFHLLERLYRVGSVADMASKIESLYSTATSLEEVGEGMEAFVDMLSTMKKNDLSFNADSLVRGEDAVDVMTIHASKGLEQKVVYMPVSCNGFGGGSFMGGPIFEFDEKSGFIFGDYSIDFSTQTCGEDGECYKKLARTVAGMEKRKRQTSHNPDIDEHVRLFYVALTRAENRVIIVGDDDGKVENPYAFMNCAPHGDVVDEMMLREKENCGIIDATLADKYYQAKSDVIKVRQKPLSEKDMLPECWPFYTSTYDSYISEMREGFLGSCVEEIKKALFYDYASRLKRGQSLDLKAHVYFMCAHPEYLAKVDNPTFDSLIAAVRADNDQNQPKHSSDDSMDEEDEEAYSDDDVVCAKDGEYWLWSDLEWCNKIENHSAQIIHFFDECLEQEESGKAETPSAQKDRKIRIGFYLGVLSRAFDGEPFRFGPSYKTEGFADIVEYFDFTKFVSAGSSTAPALANETVKNDNLNFEPRVKRRASKTETHVDNIHDKDRDNTTFLDLGTELHRYLELLDFETMDTSYIENPEHKRLIEAVIQLPVMQEAHVSTVYPEYGFYDETSGTTGYIDLLYEKGGKFTIVDYKSSNIDDEAYVDQLHAYRRNVSRIFGVEESSIDLYLLSIMKCKTKKID